MNHTHSANNLRLIPFVIAVTGHRSIAREGQGAVLESARSVLRHFRAESGLSTTLVVLLSALAEGSDQLVAECALELGISLIAVLPFSPVEYSQTMSQSAAENMRFAHHPLRLSDTTSAINNGFNSLDGRSDSSRCLPPRRHVFSGELPGVAGALGRSTP